MQSAGFKDAFITNQGGVAVAETEPYNEPIATKPKPQPTIERLANEVIAGVHGVGEARKKALGSRYAEVQAKVDQLLGVTNTVIRVGDRVTASKLYGTGQGATPARTTPITGYVERIDSGWKNPYRLVGTKGRQDYLGFARGVDIKK